MDTLVLEKPTATTEELIEKLYQTEGKAEIVNGEIIEYVATGCEPDIAGGNIFVSLKMYQRKIKNGIAYGDNIGFIVNLPNRKSFSPDAAYYVGKSTEMKFLQGAPIILPPELKLSGTLIY